MVFAFFVVKILLRFFVKRPPLFQRLHFRHQHEQICVGARTDGMGAEPHATSQAVWPELFT